MHSSSEVIEISFPLPKAPHAILQGHITFETGYLMAHLTTSELGEPSGLQAPLGSFVYAMPNLNNQSDILSTNLVSSGSSIDYAARLAKVLARKTSLPVYIGCSMNFRGITSEEEMEGFRQAVDEIMTRFHAFQEKTSRADS